MVVRDGEPLPNVARSVRSHAGNRFEFLGRRCRQRIERGIMLHQELGDRRPDPSDAEPGQHAAEGLLLGLLDRFHQVTRLLLGKSLQREQLFDS